METAFWNLFVVKSNPKLVSIERKKQLLKAKIKAKQLANQEKFTEHLESTAAEEVALVS